MAVSLDVIAEISRAIVREHRGGLEVAGVTSSGGGSNRIEVVITVTGCHAEPCRFVIDVPRAERAQFERDLRVKLVAALNQHRAQTSP